MKSVLLAGTVLVLCASLIGASSVAAAPQGGSGVVTGVVLDADNKPVPNAVITYQNSGGSAPHMAHADAHGHFTISKLKGDVYAVRATNNGMSSDWENVAVHPGKTRTIALHTIHEKEEVKQFTATHTYEVKPE
jgi:Carboxypeptidase regulatory-like domain